MPAGDLRGTNTSDELDAVQILGRQIAQNLHHMPCPAPEASCSATSPGTATTPDWPGRPAPTSTRPASTTEPYRLWPWPEQWLPTQHRAPRPIAERTRARGHTLQVASTAGDQIQAKGQRSRGRRPAPFPRSRRRTTPGRGLRQPGAHLVRRLRGSLRPGRPGAAGGGLGGCAAPAGRPGPLREATPPLYLDGASHQGHRACWERSVLSSRAGGRSRRPAARSPCAGWASLRSVARR